MADWATYLLCLKCGDKLELPYAEGVSGCICHNCNKQYTIIPHEMSYAVAESSSCDYIRYQSENEIEKRCFSNHPLDLLEEAWQDMQSIHREEMNPHILLPITKKYHDAVKSHGRRLLELHPSALTSKDIHRIQIDNSKSQGLNIKNLFELLASAYPIEVPKINSFYSANKNLILRLYWIRNKQEHVLFSQWGINAKIFEDNDNNPNDPATPCDYLNYDFILRINDLCVDVCRLIIDLRPGLAESWQYAAVERFRCY